MPAFKAQCKPRYCACEVLQTIEHVTQSFFTATWTYTFAHRRRINPLLLDTTVLYQRLLQAYILTDALALQPELTPVCTSTSRILHDLVQDSRVETYLQSQEEEGTDMLAGLQAWAHNASASLQRIVHQAVPATQKQHALAEDEGVSTEYVDLLWRLSQARFMPIIDKASVAC